MMNAQSAASSRMLYAFLLLFSASIALSKSAANVLLSLIYLAVAVQIFRDRQFRMSLRDNAMQPLLLPLLLFVAVAALGLTYTERISDGFGVLNKIVGLALVYFMTAVMIDMVPDESGRSRTAEDLLLLFIAGIVVLDLIGLLTYFGVIGQRKFTLPVYPLHVHHIWFANLNAIGLYATLSFLFFNPGSMSKWRRGLLFTILPLAVFSILLSTSRTAWLGMLATGIVIAYFYIPRRRLFLAALWIAIVCCVLAYLSIPLVRERIDGGFADIAQFAAGRQETSMGWRFLMWKASLMMFQTDPVLGVGTGDYVITMERFIGSGVYPESLLQFNQPHNMYLFVLATNGVLGLGALFYLFYRVFAASLTRKAAIGTRWQSFLAVSVAVHYLVAGLTDSLFNIFILRFAFAFVMGICIRQSIIFPSKIR